MATQVQLRRGTTSEHSAFTGAVGEVTIDTDKDTVVVHDGSVAGGRPLMRENGSQNLVTTGTATAGSFIPTSSTAPTNGVYLPAANSVAISTGGSGRLFVNANGTVAIGATSHGNPSNYLVDIAGTGSQFTRVITTDTTATSSIGAFRAEFLGGGGGANTSVELRAGNGYTYLTSTTNHPLLFGTNTTERLRIDSLGRVGIATSSPINTLDVNGGIGLSYATGLRAVRDQYSVNNSIIRHQYVGSDDQLQLAPIGDSPTSSIAFRTALSSTLATRMFISPSGLVGVGTSSPGTTLDVKGSVRSSIGTGTGAGGAGYALYQFGTSSTATENWHIGAEGDGSFRFYNQGIGAGQERLRITSAGLVGIGTSSPSNTLHCQTTATSSDLVYFYNQGATGSDVLRLNTEGVGSGTTVLDVQSAGTSRLVVLGTGNVGIGTTSPANRLDIVCSQGDGLRILESTSGNNARLLLTQESGGVTYNATFSAGSNAHIWQVANAERARIDSSGRLLVGTSSAINSQKLQIAGDNNQASFLGFNGSNSNGPMLSFYRSRSSTTGTNTIVQNNDETGSVDFFGADGTNYIRTASIASNVDGTPGANDMPGRLVFSTTADGASSPTERLRIDSAGQIEAGSLGTAAAPVWSFLNDPNTGIYSPGADQVAISTNGTRRLIILSDGKVGLGAASVLQQGSGVDGGSGAGILELYNGGTGNTTLENTGAFPILFKTNGSERLRITSTGTVNIVGAGTAGSTQAVSFNGSAPVNSLVVDSSGRVGVGIASPSSTYLHVYTTAPGTVSAPTICLEGGANGYGAGIDFASRTSAGGTLVSMAKITADGEAAWNTTASTQDANLRFFTADNGSLFERLRITSAGLVGVGTSSPVWPLDVRGSGNFFIEDGFLGIDAQSSPRIGFVKKTGGAPFLAVGSATSFQISHSSATEINPVSTNTYTPRLTIDTSGRVGIGTTSPNAALTVSNSGAAGLEFFPATFEIQAYNRSTSAYGLARYNAAGHQFAVSASEVARIDSSGRLLVGTSSSTNNIRLSQKLAVVNTDANYGGLSLTSYSGASNQDLSPVLDFQRSRGTSDGSMTTVASGDSLGFISFRGADGTSYANAASINCVVEGTPAAGKIGSRLVLSTTADGADSPTERMRITNDGAIGIGENLGAQIASSSTSDGFYYKDSVGLQIARAGSTVATFNRRSDDGTIVSLRQAGVEEGTISVSGTTVSYNGAHLSRWSQLPSGAERIEILRGSVLSNIDEMCEWGEEDNEQLNRMKVSDVEGDKNVSGVFQAWDDDDDTYTNDFYCAMTGDFIIRIAQGVIVERGDLLMSAGDGTAKPQDDDIIRSKTIAKVTSTNVTCTYEDGSYCVPCVLMAC